MKKIFFVCLLFLPVWFAVAQEDTKAKAILEEVSNKTKSLKSIVAEFAFTMQNKEMDINERNTGSIRIKGQKYQVDLPEIGIRVFSDGKSVWNYMKDGNQVTITDVDDESNELMNPSSLFSIYEKGFTPKYVAEKKSGDKTLIQIDLFPQDKTRDVSRVTVMFNKESKMIHSALMYGTDGNLYGIEVLRFDSGREIPESEFVFDTSKYPDLEVIDFR